MKVPKYIIKKLNKRAEYGRKVSALDSEFMQWCINKGIDFYETFQGVSELNSILLLTEPDTLTQRQIEILKKYKRNKI